jgi:hypothetical protein
LHHRANYSLKNEFNMDILLNYRIHSALAEHEVEEIIKLSKRHGKVDARKRGVGSGAIDLVALLEFSVEYGIAKIVYEAFLKGVLNENYIKQLGESVRKEMLMQISDVGNYISAFYKVFISKKQDIREAIVFIEQFENYTIYVVLNEHRATQKLADGAVEALVKLCSFIALTQIETESPFVLQLYPNYATETWDYVFVPTAQAYGKFIDKYFDFGDNSFHYIDSAEEFINKFEITDFDEYKFIISAKYHLSR